MNDPVQFVAKKNGRLDWFIGRVLRRYKTGLVKVTGENISGEKVIVTIKESGISPVEFS